MAKIILLIVFPLRERDTNIWWPNPADAAAAVVAVVAVAAAAAVAALFISTFFFFSLRGRLVSA